MDVSVSGEGLAGGVGGAEDGKHTGVRQRRRERKEPRRRGKGQTSDIDNRETQGTQHLTESDGR